MKKKKNDNTKEQEVEKEEGKSKQIMSIALVIVFAFLILSPFGKAGIVGNKVYSIFSILFGVGYFILPFMVLLLAIFIKNFKENFGISKTINFFLFFVFSLAILDMTIKKGGLLGNIIDRPLIALFDVYTTTVILIGFITINLLVVFEDTLGIENLKKRFLKSKEEVKLNKEEVVKISGVEPTTEPNKKPEIKVPQSQAKNKDDDEMKILKLNNTLSFSSKEWTPPPLSILERDKGKPEVGDIKANANIIKRTLNNFGIIVEMDEISIGPSVTRYALKPAEGVKLSKILGLQNNLELALAAHPVRIEAPIPGKSLVGIEIPNTVKTTVGLASLFSQTEYTDSPKPLIIALGKGISGNAQFANLAKMPHLLIAGATGSGKSVSIHAIINSMLFRNSPDNLKFIMIDPKRVELTLYNKIPHLLTPVITDAKKTILALKWAAKEMDRRYGVLETHKVRDIESYHRNILNSQQKDKDATKTLETMPYLVIIIDELADIMQTYPRELEAAIIRLAQMSRAVGIHLILSTQRPSVNVITGLIKANIPTRIALQVASQFDSRTILDSAGAEKLLGAGDMLYLSGEMSKPIRLQSPFISENEVKQVVEYLSKGSEDEIPSEINLEHSSENNPKAIFDSSSDDDVEDELYEEAKETVIASGKASTSFLQRKLRIGYARAARLIDILEEHQVIGPGEGAKPREVLIKNESVTQNQENPEDDEII